MELHEAAFQLTSHALRLTELPLYQYFIAVLACLQFIFSHSMAGAYAV